MYSFFNITVYVHSSIDRYIVHRLVNNLVNTWLEVPVVLHYRTN